jgi:hypothetical protein
VVVGRVHVAMTTVLLVCEGSCNPNLRHVDLLVQRELRLDGCVIVSDETARMLRRLEHTEHVMVTPHVARCLTCKTERRYGNTQW